MTTPNARGNAGFPKTDPWKAMNLENRNQANKSRQNRPLNAFFDPRCASALVYFEPYFSANPSLASRQSHAPTQNSSASGMERENSGFSIQN